MKLAAFFLADHAEAVNGKLYVVGGCWDNVNVSALPATHPHLSVCTALQVSWEETNRKHAFAIELVDADGRRVLPQTLGGEFEAGRPAGSRPGDWTTLVMVLNVNMLPLEQVGTYEFVLSVDGEPLGRAGFKVRQAEQPAD